MKWHDDFTSSNVARLGYDEDTKEVGVQFKNKAGSPTATWIYWPLDKSDFDAIHTAPSVGRAVNEYLVRSRTYNSRKEVG